jgi:ABC-type transport system involved in multi-copper enzyme maturation permease subunit
MNLLFSNPILMREITHRMRDKRTYFIPTVYLSLLGLAAAAVYLMSTQNAAQTGVYSAAAAVGPDMGNTIFVITVVLQTTLVILLVPSLSGAAITAERDRGCLVPILVTPMSRAALTIGKLLAPILYIFFLLFISLPFAALSFGFGGTDLTTLLSAYSLVVATTIFFASMGLFISTLFQRTTPSVMLSYAAAATILIGAPIVDLLINAMLGNSSYLIFSVLNPFFALILLISNESFGGNAPGVWWITPILHVFLSMVFLLFAGVKMKKMRE